MSRPILILGTTEYAQVFLDSFEGVEDVRFSGCVENMDRSRCSEQLLGLPIYWFEDLEAFLPTHDLICSLATTLRRSWVATMEDMGFPFATLVHPTATFSKRSTIGEGCSLDVGTVVAGFSQFSPHVRVGRRVSVGHHTSVGSFSTLHPGCIVSGECHIGRQVTIGTGAVILDGISVGDKAVIAAGSVVRKDVQSGEMVVGNPATTKRLGYGPK